MNSLMTIGFLSMLVGASPEQTTARIPQVPFEKYTLPNGLEVILHEDHSTPIVGVNLWYHVGSKNEQPGRTGFAHLFEHMMFQGSKHFDNDYFAPLQEAGGKLNGSTSRDRTNYWETVPSNYLELAIWMESDRMGFLLPAMTQEKFENQRDVVKNERRQSYENRPYGVVLETLWAALYPPDHSYSWPTIGSMVDIDAATREDVSDFFRRYYHPGNASLCIAGDFDPAEAKRLVEKYFGPIPTGPAVEQPAVRQLSLDQMKRIQMTDRVSLSRLYLAWHTVPLFAEDDAELDMLAEVLAGGETSRMYRSLVREKQIAQDVQAFQYSGEQGGDFMVIATARPGHTLEEVEAAIMAEIAEVKAEPPVAEELSRAINQHETDVVRSLESISGFGGRADRLNMYNIYAGDPGFLTKDFERYLQVTPEDVSRVAKKYLGDKFVALAVEPGEETTIDPDPRQPAAETRVELAANAAELPALGEAPEILEDEDRQTLPSAGPSPQLRLPPIDRSRLSNGMQVLVVEDHRLPSVSINVVFPQGRAQEPLDKLGLANLTSQVWDKGTETRSAEQIAEDLAGIGTSLNLSTSSDATAARLVTLKHHLPRALEIATDVLLHPAFPSDELDRERKRALARLMQVRDESRALAGLAVVGLLYGQDHPYGKFSYGTPETLASLTRDDLQQFYRQHIRPEEASVIVVGDVTRDAIIQQLDQTLGTWQVDGEVSEMKFPPVPAMPPTRVILVDKPGAEQSEISVGLIGAERNCPDYFDLIVMNAIFGGQFSSRLNMNLREDKGYTYGAAFLVFLAGAPTGSVLGIGQRREVRYRRRVDRVPERV